MKESFLQMANSNRSSSPVRAAKISGYLEKKGRLRIGSQWKKYWFVLEGRLLLYYRSKDEYDSLSPCKGSINLCPPCTIQPTSSLNCTFQVECRGHIVTLKAQNRCDQDRWLQAILSAIDRSKSASPNRMTHFRYSLDDIPTKTAENNNKKVKFTRQNTMPYRLSSSPAASNRQEMLGGTQRINSIYGGSLETISKATSSEDENSSRNSAQSRRDRLSGFLIENEQYSIIQEEKSIDVAAYESQNKINLPNKSLQLSPKEEENAQEYRRVEHLYERISRDSISLNNNDIPQNAHDIQSKNYALYEHISENYSDIPKTTELINNQEYSVVQKSRKCSNSSTSRIDHNKNSLLVENEQYVFATENPLEDNIYADYNLYEDPDVLKIPKIQFPEETISQTSSSNDSKNKDLKKPKRFKIINFSDHQAKKKEADTAVVKKRPTKKKSRTVSFLKKVVWRRHKKSKSLEGSDEEIYDSIDDNEFVKKQKQENEADIEMLEELQKILEMRKSALQKKVMDNTKRSSRDSVKKSSSEIASLVAKNKKAAEKSPVIRPSLPPRQGSSSRLSRASLEDNEEKSQRIKSIDEILKDLDKEEDIQQTRQKVKQLIGLFNKLHKKEDDSDVVMRRSLRLIKSTSADAVTRITDKVVTKQSRKDADELDRLLDELAKVTTAPVMTPGVTNSLMVTPVLTDEEWLQLIPIRKRRLSEPDYDVPRPHSSLILLQRPKPQENDPIPVTRFFGPILPPTLTVNPDLPQSSSPPVLLSPTIDPDSLEITQIVSSEEGSKSPQKTNGHLKFKLSEVEVNEGDKKINEQNDVVEKDVLGYKNDENFVDSLEPVIELSTPF